MPSIRNYSFHAVRVHKFRDESSAHLNLHYRFVNKKRSTGRVPEILIAYLIEITSYLETPVDLLVIDELRIFIQFCIFMNVITKVKFKLSTLNIVMRVFHFEYLMLFYILCKYVIINFIYYTNKFILFCKFLHLQL